MNLEIPSELGNSEYFLKEDRPTIIFGADSHISQYSQDNLTRLYLHLAENYGVKVVGVENCTHNLEFPKSEAKIDLETIKWVIDNHAFEDDPENPVYGAGFLITCIASQRGYELTIPRAGYEEQLAKIWDVIKYYSENRLKNDLSLGLALQKILNGLPNYIRKGVEGKLITFVTDPSNQEKWNDLNADLWFLRTQEQMEGLVGIMEARGATLSLLLRGADHRGEFIEIANSSDLGYILFTPSGIEIDHPSQLAKWKADRRESAIKIIEK